jgi:glycosyltransferase involved in cell wall biosynthesis
MKNVVFFIGSLQAGGTEAKLARNFLPLLKMRGKVNPKLLLLQEKGEFLDVLPREIEKVCLNENTHTSLFGVIPKFREALRKLKPDIVIACMWYPAIIAYMTKKLGLFDFKYIVHDTTTMSEYIKYEFSKERHKWLKIYLIRKAYMAAEKIIVVSKGEKDDLTANFAIPDKLVEVIYNPVNLDEIRRMAGDDVDVRFDKPTVVSVGRLIYSKGFDVLLKAFRKVNNHVDCNLLILGEGKEKETLMSLSESLGLREKVTFLGFHHNPFKYMKRCQVFCTATRYEGLGNALIEAMTVGLPVIATDCRSGPVETLDGGKYGILVAPEDPDATAQALIRVLSDRKLQENLSNLSLKRAQDFDPETSMKQWEDAILAMSG